MKPPSRIVSPAASDYSAGAIVGRFARAIGIVLIFSIVGPLTTAALISLIVIVFGAALLQMFLALLELDALRTMISVAVGLLAFVTMLASFLPSVAAVVLGGTSLLGGRGNLVATAVAALFLSQLDQFVLALGVTYATRTLVQAAALAVGVALYTVNWGALARRLAGRRVASIAPT